MKTRMGGLAALLLCAGTALAADSERQTTITIRATFGDDAPFIHQLTVVQDPRPRN